MDRNEQNSYDFNAFDADRASDNASYRFDFGVDEPSQRLPRVVATLPSDFFGRASNRPKKTMRISKNLLLKKAAPICCYIALGVSIGLLFNDNVGNGNGQNQLVTNDSSAKQSDDSLSDGFDSVAGNSHTLSFEALYGADPKVAPIDNPLDNISKPNDATYPDPNDAIGVADVERGRFADAYVPSWSEVGENQQSSSAEALYSNLVAPTAAQYSDEFDGSESESYASYAPSRASNAPQTPERASVGFGDYERPSMETQDSQYASVSPSPRGSRFVGYQTDAPVYRPEEETTAVASNNFVPTFDNPEPRPTDNRMERVAQNFDESFPQRAVDSSAVVSPTRTLRW